MKYKKQKQVFRTKNKPAQKGKLIKFPQFIKALRSKLWFIFLMTIVIVFFAEIILMAEAIFNNIPILYWLSSIITGILFLLLVKFADSETSFSIVDMSFSKRELGIGLICGLGILAWLIIADQTISMIFTIDYLRLGGNGQFFQPLLFGVAKIGKGIILPLSEEMLFRNYFLSKFIKKRNMYVALLLNGLLFGIRALDPFIFIINFVSGLVLGTLFIKVSLRSAIIASITANIGVLLISFFYLH